MGINNYQLDCDIKRFLLNDSLIGPLGEIKHYINYASNEEKNYLRVTPKVNYNKRIFLINRFDKLQKTYSHSSKKYIIEVYKNE